MLFLAVNFHYIHREDKYPFEGIHPTTPFDFVRQTDELGKYFQFISQDDLILALERRKELPERSCLLCFDDGLKSQYQEALPILKRKNIPAIFFINSQPIKEKKACVIHKVHWLRANMASADFWARVDYNLSQVSGKSLNDFSCDEKLYQEQHPYDDPETARLKYTLNYIVPSNDKEIVINRIFQELVKDEGRFCEMFYMSAEEIAELGKLSFLGVHSFSHKFLCQLPEEEAARQISGDIQTLLDISQTRVKAISYPYGGVQAVDLKLARLCQSLGLKFGLTMEKSFNRTLDEPLLFARITTNMALAGKSPAFCFENNQLKIMHTLGPSRQLFFKEQYE